MSETCKEYYIYATSDEFYTNYKPGNFHSKNDFISKKIVENNSILSEQIALLHEKEKWQMAFKRELNLFLKVLFSNHLSSFVCCLILILFSVLYPLSLDKTISIGTGPVSLLLLIPLMFFFLGVNFFPVFKPVKSGLDNLGCYQYGVGDLLNLLWFPLTFVVQPLAADIDCILPLFVLLAYILFVCFSFGVVGLYWVLIPFIVYHTLAFLSCGVTCNCYQIAEMLRTVKKYPDTTFYIMNNVPYGIYFSLDIIYRGIFKDLIFMITLLLLFLSLAGKMPIGSNGQIGLICFIFCYWYIYNLVTFILIFNFQRITYNRRMDSKKEYFTKGVCVIDIQTKTLIQTFTAALFGIFLATLLATTAVLCYQIYIKERTLSYIVAFVPLMILFVGMIGIGNINLVCFNPRKMCPLLCPDWCGVFKTIFCLQCERFQQGDAYI
ncbi:hypothetical protein EIN_016640 [Entamoeba invadens IP1]|uniref:hypothetical protein n=1 Tax=Entamoeba invadens IP1 TaxID=370355 RepID=UPI0002C3F210|nr:hypothetical protein EIN_016640 [Entamoeba invadens IP1]ELP90435.1 hypothetical protein EIN_016640 [Entamoeba invadens IP1]|eukprot:XP_004257206.1 hypothetical protein EIN_016640 [Entamoeba invadens IP1]